MKTNKKTFLEILTEVIEDWNKRIKAFQLKTITKHNDKVIKKELEKEDE